MDMTKAALMGLGSKVEGGKFRENDFSIMPPPPSPAWRRVATPKRESSVQKSPQSSYSDLFPDENLTECQAVPSHLFSPMRQAELAGGKAPRYQEIPLDYPRPRSVNSSNMDSWLNSPGGPSTPGGRYTPSLPPTPGTPATHDYHIVVAPAPTTGPGLAFAAPIPAGALRAYQRDISEGQPRDKAKSIDVQIEMLAKNAEKDENLKSDIFRQMNNILNEETINSENSKLIQKPKTVIKKLTESYRVVQTVKISPKKPAVNVSRGSWRFSSEHSSEPFVPVVRVKNDALTRPMVLKKTYDFYQPAVQAIVKKEVTKKHSLKVKDAVCVSKKQKIEETSDLLVPQSRKVNYVCKDCSRRCSSLKDVKGHPCFPKIQCEDCKPVVNNFQNRKLLLLHLSHSHPAVGQRFDCQFCDKGASNKTYLRDHIKKFHPLEFIEIYGVQEINEEENGNDVLVSVVEKDPTEFIGNEKEVVEETPEPPNDDQNETSSLCEVAETNHAVDIVDTFDEDIDAPDSVVSSSHETQEVGETPQTFSFHCDKCKKGFHTSMRHKNHKKNCVGQKAVSIVESSQVAEQKLAKAAGVHKSVKVSSRRRNARFEQLKSNWSELLEGRERCGKCGRNNYAQDDLEKHKKVCRGTLLDSRSRYICPHCTKPSRVFNTENAMRRHVSTNHAKEAMEDDWDYKHVEEGWKGMAMAKKHLFR